MHMISREEVRSSILKPLHRIFPPSVYASSPHSPKEKKKFNSCIYETATEYPTAKHLSVSA